MREGWGEGRADADRSSLTRGGLLRRGLGAGAGLTVLGGGEALGALRRSGGAAAEAGKLSVWLAGFGATAKTGTPLRRWYDHGVARFVKAHPGSSVQTTLQSATIDQFLAVLRAAFAAHKTPDVMMLYAGGYTIDYGKSLVDLRKYVDASFYKRFNAWQLSCDKFDCTKGNPIYGVPNDVGGFVLFYNKQHFAKAGLPNRAFRNWDEMLAGARKLKDAGYIPFAMGNRDGYSAANWVAVMLGSYIKSPSDIALFRSGKIKWNDPRMVKPVDQYSKLFSDGLTNDDARTREQIDANDDFTSGKASMVLMYPSLVVDFRKGLGDTLGIMKLPPAASGPLSHAMNVVSGQDWVIPKDAKNPDLAFEFIRVLSDDTSQAESLKLTATPPANRGASLGVVKDPVLKSFLKYLQETPSFPLIDSVVAADVATVWYKQLGLAFAGKTSGKSAMDKVEQAAKHEKI